MAPSRLAQGVALSILLLASGCFVLRGGSGDAPEETALDFWLLASARVEDGGAWIDTWATRPTLRMGVREAGLSAPSRVRWTVEILTQPEGRELHETSWLDVADADSARVGARRSFEVPPGAFLVVVTAEDEATGVVASERREVAVPSPDATAIVGLRVERRQQGRWQPIVGSEVSPAGDSLRVVAQVVRADSVAHLVVERMDADEEAAPPPFQVEPPPSPLVARGVADSEAIRDTLYTVSRSVGSETFRLAQQLPPLQPGVYRVRVLADDSAAHADLAVVVRREGYPEIERIGDLVEALAYIATAGEMRMLTARLDPFAQRRAFDRFWGDLLPDRRRAGETVRAFAARVEAANRLFATQKDGWKTDQGLAHVLFGPPARVLREAQSESWTYTTGPVAGLTLTFRRTRQGTADWPFEVWTLDRNPAYEVAWRRARRAWRQGQPPGL